MRESKAANVWRWPLVTTAITIGVLVVSGILVLRLGGAAANETRSSFQWTTHTLEVENALHEMLGALEQAESAQRGYLIAEDEVYLTSLIPAIDSAQRLLAASRLLTRDNREQQRRLDTVGGLVSARLALLQLGVGLARAGRRDSVSRLVKYGPGRVVMDSVRATVGRAIAAENILRAQRQQAVDSALGRRRLAESLIMAIAFLALALASGVWLWLRRAGQLVTICAWSKAIKYNDEWMSIETYMHRQYGIHITHGISPAESARLEYGTREGTGVS